MSIHEIWCIDFDTRYRSHYTEGHDANGYPDRDRIAMLAGLCI